MKFDTRKFEIIVAEKQLNYGEICKRAGISRQVLRTVRKRKTANPPTIGKIANALGVDVAEIIQTEV